MLFFLLACKVPPGASEQDSAEETDSVEELDCGHEPPDELNIDPERACHDGDELLVESDYDGPGTHFDWTVEECFFAAGGSIPDVDAPSVVIQCPPCGDLATEIYDVTIEFMDEEGDPVGWGFGWFAQVCANQ